MLVEHPRDVAGGATLGSRLREPRTLAVAGVAAVLALLVGLQIVASVSGFDGPLASLARDFVGTPKSMSVPWAGLVLALVGISTRRRGQR